MSFGFPDRRLALGAAAIFLIAPAAAAEAATLRFVKEARANTIGFAIEVQAAPGVPDRIYSLDLLSGEIRYRDRGDPIDVASTFFRLPRPTDPVPGDFEPNFTLERYAYSFAFAPDYETSGRFFVSYVNTDGDVKVIEGARITDDIADTAVKEIATFDIVDFASTHFGADLDVGPDGALYLTTGDGDRPFDEVQSQNPASDEGKVFRIDVSGPTVGPDDITQVARGLRNPAQAVWDGDTYIIADVGERRFEEINILTAGDIAGNVVANYGWPVREGFAGFPSGQSPSDPVLTDPILTYSDGSTRNAISGGAVIRGGLPELEGLYLFGDVVSGEIFSTRIDPVSGTATPLISYDLTFDQPPGANWVTLNFANGDLYATDVSDGLFRLVSASVPLPAPLWLLAGGLGLMGLAARRG